MKFLVYSISGKGLPLAYRLQQEGHDVCISYRDKDNEHGIWSLVRECRSFSKELIDRPIVIFDSTGAGILADRLKGLGHKVIGAGMGLHRGKSLSDKLEQDRRFALEIMETMGIRTSGDPAFPMQQHFVPGYELTTEIFFQNGKPVLPPDSSFQTNKFLVGDLGPDTECQTSVVWGYREREPRIYQKTLKKMLTFIDGTGYTGPFGIRTVIGRKDGEPYGTEFVPRFDYNAIFATLECLNVEAGQFFSDLAEGTLKEIPWRQGFGGSLRVSVPPYPYKSDIDHLDYELYSEARGGRVEVDFEGRNYLPVDIIKKEDGGYYTAGALAAPVLEVIGHGTSLQTLGKDVYSKAGRIQLKDKQYRLDMVGNAQQRWSSLVKMGYVKGMNNGISSGSN